jgi:tetratricopeptide (TPR) repeat protein
MLEYYGFAAAHFPALYDLEMHNWADAAALQPAANASPDLQRITWWARTIASARMGDVEATRRNAQKFDEAEEATRKTKDAYVLDGPNSSRGEVHAWLAFAEKQNDEALRQMRQVADTQDETGKAEVDIPAREMLADMLLELNRPQEALAEYEKSMKIDPNRFNELAGAAQAAELSHQPQKASTLLRATVEELRRRESTPTAPHYAAPRRCWQRAANSAAAAPAQDRWLRSSRMPDPGAANAEATKQHSD